MFRWRSEIENEIKNNNSKYTLFRLRRGNFPLCQLTSTCVQLTVSFFLGNKNGNSVLWPRESILTEIHKKKE